MAVYQPTYTDKATGKKRASRIWWYEFTFADRRIRESSKSTRKTVAVEAEKKRRAELERAFNGIEDKRSERIRIIDEIADVYFEGYKLRHRSVKFAEYALGHVKRLLGKTMAVNITDATVKDYQLKRLKESAAPKSINEEVGFLLRILEDRGDVIRIKMRRQKTLKLKSTSRIAKAFTPAEKTAMLAAAKSRRSPHILPALSLMLNAGLRDNELRNLQWERVDLVKAIVRVGESKTEAGEGRTIPLNSEMLATFKDHAKWYLKKFGETRPAWYVFPFGRPQPTDPTRPVTSLKTAWIRVKKDSNITGRWHDNRHTLITDLAESGEAGDETIRDIAGHVSQKMLRHYSHIRMEAKRRAVAALVAKPRREIEPVPIQDSIEALQEVPKVGPVQ